MSGPSAWQDAFTPPMSPVKKEYDFQKIKLSKRITEKTEEYFAHFPIDLDLRNVQVSLVY